MIKVVNVSMLDYIDSMNNSDPNLLNDQFYRQQYIDYQISNNIPLNVTVENKNLLNKNLPYIQPKNDSYFWSNNIGLQHTIYLSGEIYIDNNLKLIHKQYDWLINDLQKASQQRKTFPFIMVILYVNNKKMDSQTSQLVCRHMLIEMFNYL